MSEEQEARTLTAPEIQDCEGSPLLALPHGRKSFRLGLAKAKRVLQHLAALQAFVASEGKKLTA